MRSAARDPARRNFGRRGAAAACGRIHRCRPWTTNISCEAVRRRDRQLQRARPAIAGYAEYPPRLCEFPARSSRRDCGTHLDEAQIQLDAAKANPALTVALPAGPARVAHIEYQLHSARASCGASAAVRDQELRAALESAQRAVELYRDDFDAVSMVTMQFNVASPITTWATAVGCHSGAEDDHGLGPRIRFRGRRSGQLPSAAAVEQ